MEQQETLRFGRFEIRRRHSQLLADGKPVELGSRAFDVLLALIDAAGSGCGMRSRRTSRRSAGSTE